MRRPRSLSNGPIVLMLGASLLAAACGGSASAAPTLAPGETATPAPGTTANPGSSAGTPDGALAFGQATSELDALDSYEFNAEIASTTTTAGVENRNRTVMTGVVVNRPDKASSLQMDEYDDSGNISSTTGIVIIGDASWVRNDASGPWEAIPLAQASLFAQSFAAFRPEKLFGVYFATLGNDFTNAGNETKNGVPSTHYKGGEGIGSVFAAIAQFQGTWTSDVWLATDGNYLVHSEAIGQGTADGDTGSFKMTVDISKPNSAGPIETPGVEG
ncbi:MAG: hypothetical protein ABI573_04860 [Chloroflexota bacterium]